MLVTIVAVFLSYNANHGLPFVPTYKVDVVLPNAAGLIAGNEVRIGGAPRRHRAQDRRDRPPRRLDRRALELALDDTRRPPAASTARSGSGRSRRSGSSTSRSPAARRRGRSRPDGDADTSRASTPRPVDIDDFFNMFDEPDARRARRDNLIEYGTAFAGRGGDLNKALARPRPARRARRARRRATSPRPRRSFDRLFPAFAQAAAEVAPVAEVQGGCSASLDTTFARLRRQRARRCEAGDRRRPTRARRRDARAARPGRLRGRQRRAVPPLPDAVHGRWPPRRRTWRRRSAPARPR